MTEATQRAHLKTIIDSVANIGQTYDYLVWAMHWSDILSKFKTTISGDDVIRGWTMEVRAIPGETITWEYNSTGKSTAVVLRSYRWVIHGFLSLKDDSEKTAAALGEVVANALDLDSDLHDQDAYYNDTPPCSIDVMELRNFGGVLCHYIEISQQLQETTALKEA